MPVFTFLPLLWLAGLSGLSTLTTSPVAIKINLSRQSSPSAGYILQEAKTISTFYYLQFGSAPTAEFTITDIPPADSFITANYVYIQQKPNPFLRLFERHLATQIARYWLATTNSRDPFLADGLPAYLATRYLEAVYGKNNLLNLSVPFIENASDRYLHQLYYYTSATNHLSRPITEPPDTTDPFRYDAYKSQAVLVLQALENELGTAIIDSAIRFFCNRSAKTTPAFLACLSAVAGPQKEVLINRLFNQDGRNDLKITGLYRKGDSLTVNIAARNPLPVPVELKTVFADNSFRLDTVVEPQPISLTLPQNKKVKQVIIDPDRKLLEPDRWNNLYPRKITVKPIFALPDFESYQLFYGPWFWYDNYRGFQPGIWLQGRRMIDAGPLRGDHNWSLIHNYASKKSDWHTGLTYQTPIIFYPPRLRFYIAGDNSFRDRGVKGYLLAEFGQPFRLPKNEIQFGYRFYELIDSFARDPRAWRLARIAELRAKISRTTRTPKLLSKHELTFVQGLKPLLSQYHYFKLSLEGNLVTRPFWFRIFAGAISGSVPPQEEFYLSGALTATDAEPITWSYEGISSAQEHWHYDGDVNCRAYSGLYRHGKFAYGVNIHLVLNRYIQPFLDLGNVADSLNHPGFFKPLFGAGVRLKLGTIYADLPFYKSAPESTESHFAFRWSLGFKLTELFKF